MSRTRRTAAFGPFARATRIGMQRKRTPIAIQHRDLALLRGLFECRVMASRHVAELYFGGHSEMAKKRLQRLEAAGLVASRSAARFAKANIFLIIRAICG